MATVTVTVSTPMLLVMMMMAATTMTTTRTKTMTATCFFTGYGESAKLQRVNTAAGLIHRRADTAVWYVYTCIHRLVHMHTRLVPACRTNYSLLSCRTNICRTNSGHRDKAGIC